MFFSDSWGAVFLAVSVTAMPAGHAMAADPAGEWVRGDGNARVRIAPCGSSICATNVWIGDTSGGEEVGDRLVMTVAPAAADTLKGKAFDPKRNMTYSISIKVGDAKLVTRGCVAGGLLCKAVSWSRAD